MSSTNDSSKKGARGCVGLIDWNNLTTQFNKRHTAQHRTHIIEQRNDVEKRRAQERGKELNEYSQKDIRETKRSKDVWFKGLDSPYMKTIPMKCCVIGIFVST